MNHLAELVATVTAGAIGSAVAAMAVGASLLLVLPVMVGVGAIAFVAGREERTRS